MEVRDMVIPDAAVMKKLMRVKQFYHHALRLVAAPQIAFQRILAVVTLDLGNETALHAVVSSHGAQKSFPDDFHDSLRQAERALGIPGKLPDREKLIQVHQLR